MQTAKKQRAEAIIQEESESPTVWIGPHSAGAAIRLLQATQAFNTLRLMIIFRWTAALQMLRITVVIQGVRKTGRIALSRRLFMLVGTDIRVIIDYTAPVFRYAVSIIYFVIRLRCWNVNVISLR